LQVILKAFKNSLEKTLVRFSLAAKNLHPLKFPPHIDNCLKILNKIKHLHRPHENHEKFLFKYPHKIKHLTNPESYKFFRIKSLILKAKPA